MVGQSSEAVLAKYDVLLEAKQPKVAYDTLKKAVADDASNGNPDKALSSLMSHKFAVACMDIADTKPGDRAFREFLLREGLAAAEKSIALDDSNGYAHKWVAILLGLLDPYAPGTKERIENGHRLKKHADIAAGRMPTDATVQLVLGEFCMGVSKLGWLERKAAALIFATPPESDYGEALGYCKRAAELMADPENISLHNGKCSVRAAYNVAVCNKELGNNAEAKQWYVRCSEECEPRGNAEIEVQSEARTAMQSL